MVSQNILLVICMLSVQESRLVAFIQVIRFPKITQNTKSLALGAHSHM